MMSENGKLCVIMLCVLLCSYCSLTRFGRAFAVGEVEASEAVRAARSAIVSGYAVLTDAEKAGANVTGLLFVLNNASDLLSRADLAFEKGDYEAAFSFASMSQQTLNGFNQRMSILKDNASQIGFLDYFFYGGYILGAVLVVLGSYAIWIFLKDKYGERGSVSG